MFVRIWQFHVKPARVAEFREVYGSDGAWATLFRRAPGYFGTDLLQSSTKPAVFLTIDHWESAGAWEAFLRDREDEYAALDRACEALTDSEHDLGTFRS